MINTLKIVVVFIALVLLQVLVLNHIDFSGYLNPYLYVLVILILPFEIPNWLLLVFAFILGIIIDLFSHTIGMHAFACVLMAYARPFVLKIFSPRDGYDTGSQPNAQYMGLTWFMRYAAILVVLHHFTLFFVESFTFHLFFATFFRVILSSLFTLLFILLSQLLILKR